MIDSVIGLQGHCVHLIDIYYLTFYKIIVGNQSL